jgi:APA family basic amino acid/polyamine antiporter
MTIFAAFTDLLRAASISNFAMLLYYAIANYAALKIEKPVYPRIIPVLGLITSIMLLFFLARDAWIIGGLALLSGIVFYHMEKSERIRWKI